MPRQASLKQKPLSIKGMKFKNGFVKVYQSGFSGIPFSDLNSYHYKYKIQVLFILPEGAYIMKKSSIALVALACTLLIACNNAQQINGSTLKTVNRSVTYIKDRLPVEQRIEYEVAYWTLRDEVRNNKEFLNAIDGKTPQQLIDTGKELFLKRKAAGNKEYEQFNTWEQMITEYTQERIDQNRRKTPDDRDKKNPHSVTYRMSGM